MDPKLEMYLGYLTLSLLLTGYVARTLYRNGQVFLDDAFGDVRLAKSVNHLLVVGFWLLNLGYVTVAIKVSTDVSNATQAIEALSIKMGLVLLVLGGVHFFNLYVLSRFRRRRMLEVSGPPVGPMPLVPPTEVSRPRPEPDPWRD